MSADSTVRIALLYPELLGTYGDQGNALVLRQRLCWRGVPAEVLSVRVGTPAPGQADLYVLGGGEDAEQRAALEQLRRSPAFARSLAAGAPVLAVCAGLQVLGHTSQQVDGSVEPGLGLLDATTTRAPRRAVGDVLAAVDPGLGLPPLVGFENHGGRTELGSAARPLATALVGVGNGWADRAEGAVQGSILATYLHGPVLAANPDLADLLLSRAVGGPLPPLHVPAVDALRAARLAAVQQPAPRGRRARPAR